MLSIFGHRVNHCDGRSRRSFLKAGALGLASLTLPDLLRAEQLAGSGSSPKAVINIHLDGGPPQMDLIDPKPEAPSEIRGEFRSIPTCLPGIHFSELMPKMARHADKFLFIRSLVGAASQHDAFQCQSGFDAKDLQNIGGRPAMGSVISKLLGSPQDSIPAFVDLMQGRGLTNNSARPGFLGPAYGPFRPDISHLFHRELEPGMEKQLAKLGEGHQASLALVKGLTLDRLDDRMELLKRMDRMRRDLDQSGHMDAMDHFHQQAASILTSGKVSEALDLSREDPRIVDRYTPKIQVAEDRFYTSEGPEAGRKLLLARRLIEAGVRCVNVSISDFDTHLDNFPRMRELGPIIDQALSALIIDLEQRGLIKDVMVVAWGEFGRTPQINDDGGRDHWPNVGMAIMAGGSLQTGQVIGETDRHASEAVSHPVHYQDVIATLYQHLGIDPRRTTIEDTTGRPQYLVDIGHPFSETL